MNPELLNALIIGTVVLAVLGALFALVLAFAAKAFAVEKDPREEAIAAILPGANCGGCGFPGCGGYAAAVAAGPGQCLRRRRRGGGRSDRRDYGRLRRGQCENAGPGPLHRLRPEF